eukprot:scaffold65113_cov18-Tisochrysis_lutea.AAC.4
MAIQMFCAWVYALDCHFKIGREVTDLDRACMTGVDPKLISVSIMLGASSAFMSPFGFLTNLMVYGAGGYKTMDFVKYGAGLKERICTVTTALTALHSPCD